MPVIALTTLVATSLISLPSVEVRAVDTTKANPSYFYDRETAFIINHAIDFDNGGMYVAVNNDGSLIENPIPEAVWGYEPNTIPGNFKSHIGQATCIRYLITEYQRTSVVGVEGVNDFLKTQDLQEPEDLLGIAAVCADFITNKMIIDQADNIDENPQAEISQADQGETSSVNSLYYWGYN
ncbi:MAG: hypothetical protein HC932_05190 [Thermales bacterium]|nr:hypothetical protein [Thermales bacterium]